jgi:hypothetical protein
MAKKRGINAMIEVARWSKGHSWEKRVSPRALRQIESDLKLIVAAEQQKKPTPSNAKIAAFFNHDYGISIGETTVRRMLVRVRKGEPLGSK